MELTQPPVSYDPYDPWMTDIGVSAKRAFYAGKIVGKLTSVSIALVDWLLPSISRKLIHAQKRAYPISIAQWVLMQSSMDNPRKNLDILVNTASCINGKYGTAWGLGFPWMSKNGLYGQDIPFITHTPYAMEALLHLAKFDSVKDEAKDHFQQTWKFLEALHIMFEDNGALALSYAPIEEPRIVVNANAYACYAYALHYSQECHVALSKNRATKIARWIVNQQQDDGSWYYYADNEPGNFIDGFHSCFVIKNLVKAGNIIPEIADITRDSVNNGKKFVDMAFYDPHHHLLKRFVERDIKDPYVWDLYDQAEYLGLLLVFDDIDKAKHFRNHVTSVFHRSGHWYCRKDLFGRLWGKDFYRWGIIPFIYNSKVLDNQTRN